MELAIVVVILGVIATLAVPRYRASVEKTKVSGVFSGLSEVQNLFERQRAAHGTYLGPTWEDDLDYLIPDDYRMVRLRSGNWEKRWQIVLRRQGAASGFGRYRIVWNQDGYHKSRSTVPQDLLPPGY